MHLIFFKQIIMAVIGKIRKHSTFLVIVIGVALAAFVLGDFAKGGGGSRDVNVGVVDGEDITIMDFNSEAEKNIEATMQQQQKDRLSYDEIFSVKEQTWNEMVRKIIMQKEYDNLGLMVTSSELAELIQGPNPHDLIKQYFSDPTTKQYNRSYVINYLSQLESMDNQAKQQWIRFEKYIKDDQLSKKFNNLITKGYYIPKAIAALEYGEKSDKADIDYFAVKYNSIGDSLVSPTEDDYADYYERNKEQYKDQASREIEYVVFNINPSEKDIAAARKEIYEVAEAFKTTVDVPRFVKINSDNAYDSSWYTQGTIPPQIDSLMFNSPVGTVSEPYQLNDAFHVARLMKVEHRPDSLMATHILIAFQGAYNADPEIKRTREEAVELSDSLLNVLKKSPKKLGDLAKEYSNDPSVQTNNGDLGWFKDGQMVPTFNEAVVNNKVGSFTLVESPFGYHIIKVTGKKEPVEKVKVAIIDQEILASDETNQNTFAMANKVATECRTKQEFDTYVADNKLNKRSMPSLRQMSNRIPGLSNPRNMIQWAYNKNTNVGDVSTVFELDNSFVVAVLTNKKEEGYPSLESVKNLIERKVYNELKGNYIVKEMGKYNNDLNTIKTKMDVTDKNVNSLFFTTRNLPGFVMENKVIGTVFGSENGSVTKPIIGDGAVFIVKINSIVKASETKNYSSTIDETIASFASRVNQNQPYIALKESLNVVDNRISFY